MHFKNHTMLEYEDFYNFIWRDYISQSDVSYKYREENQEFIRHLTYSMFRKYETKNVNEVVYAEVIKVFFKDLFDYQPSLYDNGEFVDFNS